MQIFAGLGNPGAKYAKNRHNIGVMAVDAIADAHGFGPWRAKFQALVAEGRLGGGKVLLMKPDTFMNKSGQAIGEAMRFYKLTAADVTVFHDELDLPPANAGSKPAAGWPAITGCGPPTPISAMTFTACGWASGIRATKIAYPLGFWAILHG